MKKHIITQSQKVDKSGLSPFEEKDSYFMDTEIMTDLQEGINQYLEGRTVKVDKVDFDKLLGL